MRTFPKLALALWSLLARRRASPSRPPPPTRRTSGASAAQFQDAWNKADAKMLADLFLTDGDYVSSTGRTARGRAEVEKAFAQQWAGIYKGTKIAVTIDERAFRAPGRGDRRRGFRGHGHERPLRQGLRARSGLSTIVAVKKGDRWYVAALRGMVPSVPEGLGK